MQVTILLLIFGLVVTTVANPRHHHHRHQHDGQHESGRFSSYPKAIQVSGAGMPFPLGNATALAASGTLLHTSYLTRTFTVTAPSQEATNMAPSSQIAAGQDSSSSGPLETQMAVSQDASKSAAVKASYLTRTVTVTVLSQEATNMASSSQIAAGQDSSSSAAVETKKAVSQDASASAAVKDKIATNACNVVTVTYAPTVTITVSPSKSEAAISTAVADEFSGLIPGSLQPASEPPVSSSAKQASGVSASSSTKRAIGGSTSSLTMPASSSIAAVHTAIIPSVGASTTPASTSKAAAAPSGTSGLRTKRGILASGPDLKLLVTGLTPYNKISWVGDWYSGPPTNLPPTMQFVPQNYGRQSDVKGEWTSNAKQAVAAGDKFFLSFGEPGTPNAQLYMSPQDAVSLFMAKMQPYATQGVTIGAPGTLQNDQDRAWLTSFLGLCDKAGCSIGFIAMHWFWTAENAQSFKDTVAKFVTLANGKPLWVDNFQAAGSAAAQKAFLQEVVPWLDAQASVARYAYVPVDRGSGEGFLNDGDGKLSDLGAFYATL